MALPGSDDFNRADGAVGANYDAANNIGTIVSNTYRVPTNSTDSFAIWNADTPGNDHYAEAVASGLGVGTGYIYVGGRASGSGNTFRAYIVNYDGATGGGNFEIDRIDANLVFTKLADVTGTVSAGDTVRLEISGSTTVTLTVKVNGSTVGTITDSDANRIASGGKFTLGGYASLVNPAVDSWAFGNLAAGSSNITPSVGALALAGLAATVAMTGSVTRTPTVGSMAFTGNAATVSVSGAVTRTPSVGALTLTGNATTVAVSGAQTRTPSAGSLTLTGLQPVQELGVAAAITGTLSLTGNPVTVLLATIRVPLVGALTLTGNAATVATARTIAPSLGSLTLTGLQATVTVGASNTTITPSVGSLVINGQAVIVAQSSPSIIPGTGGLTFTGNPPGSVSATGGGYLTRPFSFNWWRA